ncbi:hypothetical protein C4D60_Mb09t06910 [Musa balbisiana]|uniref:DUF7950 domain-containing protein n=1 Tax=Musa balbisiana TaxID=52838 RepID=A0A4V4H327_MUSBA|nr:hypothetical protein C4D60_Mb09t06910 [Musa balbisiana]
MYGGGGDADVARKVGRVMIRFRPIAPKPAAGSLSAVAAPAEAAVAARRPKRKGSANPASGASGRKPRKEEANPSPSSTIVTLSLIPETPERKGDREAAPKRSTSFPSPPSAVVVPRVVPPVGAIGSWVTVECVTDAWREGEVAWRSDEAVAAAAALAADECPGFVSDEWDRVTWINEAYRRMVVGTAQRCSSLKGGGAAEKEEEVRVGLVTQGLLPASGRCWAFTCWVRVWYAWRLRRTKGPPSPSSSSLAAPCDVWRLDGGVCAWRLDVKAALSLS